MPLLGNINTETKFLSDEETMDTKFLKRSFLQRLLGISATSQPGIDDCWNYADGKLTIDLNRASELKTPGSAIRIEGKNIPKRVLVVWGETESTVHSTIGALIWAIAVWTRFPEPTPFSAAVSISQLMIPPEIRFSARRLTRSPVIRWKRNRRN
jgi:hypothetical protein